MLAHPILLLAQPGKTHGVAQGNFETCLGRFSPKKNLRNFSLCLELEYLLNVHSMAQACRGTMQWLPSSMSLPKDTRSTWQSGTWHYQVKDKK
jgi:hypothetical protein